MEYIRAFFSLTYRRKILFKSKINFNKTKKYL